MRAIKVSTARNLMVFLTDSTDHVSGKTGATLAVTVSKNGGAFGSISPTVTERGNGWYSVALASGDTDTLGDLVVRATDTGADPAETLVEVVAYNPGDAAGLGLSRIDAAVSTRSTYDGSDTAGTGQLLGRLTTTRADKLDNLDATVTSRMPTGSVTVSGGSITAIQSGLATEANATTNKDAVIAAIPTAGTIWSNGTRTLTGAVTVSDKTGFSLASTGLDAVATTEPIGPATTFPGRINQLWSRFFRKHQSTSSELKVYQANGTSVATTQTVSSSGGTDEVGAAT